MPQSTPPFFNHPVLITSFHTHSTPSTATFLPLVQLTGDNLHSARFMTNLHSLNLLPFHKPRYILLSEAWSAADRTRLEASDPDYQKFPVVTLAEYSIRGGRKLWIDLGSEFRVEPHLLQVYPLRDPEKAAKGLPNPRMYLGKAGLWDVQGWQQDYESRGNREGSGKDSTSNQNLVPRTYT